MYVSDPVLNQIHVFSNQGRPQYIFEPTTIKDTTFGRPTALWVHAGSCLYVVDAQNNRVGLFQISAEEVRRCR